MMTLTEGQHKSNSPLSKASVSSTVGAMALKRLKSSSSIPVDTIASPSSPSSSNTPITSTLSTAAAAAAAAAATPIKSSRKKNQQQPLQSSPLSTDSPSLNTRRAVGSRNSLLQTEIICELLSKELKETIASVVDSSNFIDSVDSVDSSIDGSIDVCIPIITPVTSTATSTSSQFINTQAFLDYTKAVRSRHLDALMEAMAKRTGMGFEEAQAKRSEILQKYQ